MNPGVNIEDVKRYNQELKKYQNQASQIKAGIEFNTKELERLCRELSAELGVTVTPENIDQIRAERIAKIENTLKVGNEILQRIKNEEAQANSPMPSAPQPQMGAPAVSPFGQPQPQIQPSAQAPDSIFASIGGIPPIFGK